MYNSLTLRHLLNTYQDWRVIYGSLCSECKLILRGLLAIVKCMIMFVGIASYRTDVLYLCKSNGILVA